MISGIIVESIFRELIAGRIIHINDRKALGIENISIEKILDSISHLKPMLLHGTGQIIPSGTPLHLSPGRMRNGVRRDLEGFATDLPSIAILKALFSNQGVNLSYPMLISSANPLKLTIIGRRDDIERPRGYVHLIGPKDRFEQEDNTWQWVTVRADVQFAGCIEVEKLDFSYPVEKIWK
jgi:hypothetical protein